MNMFFPWTRCIWGIIFFVSGMLVSTMPPAPESTELLSSIPACDTCLWGPCVFSLASSQSHRFLPGVPASCTLSDACWHFLHRRFWGDFTLGGFVSSAITSVTTEKINPHEHNELSGSLLIRGQILTGFYMISKYVDFKYNKINTIGFIVCKSEQCVNISIVLGRLHTQYNDTWVHMR